MFREIDVRLIEDAVKKLCVRANIKLPDEIPDAVKSSAETELNPLGKDILLDLLKNSESAVHYNIPVCQDTGMAVVFIEVGQDVHLVGGDLTNAINSGIALGYKEGKLRMSIVGDPILRKNTNDNTPAIIYTSIAQGDRVRIKVSPKGFGSENMSRIKMFNPTASYDEIIEFVSETVSLAGGSPCPPVIVGIGIGGDFEYAAYLSKKALCRDLKERNKNPFYCDLENKILKKINSLGIGPQGFGGNTTALFVNIETYPTHIAGLPVAVNIGCHVTRHAEQTI
ncbi:MAG: fumarate hydratase [Eubacterium sp.]|jgi:fumarate hydratase subunit alpha|nr:fumarate hydratase [Eubacterium sp.]